MPALDFSRYAPELPYGFEEEATRSNDAIGSETVPAHKYEPMPVREAFMLLFMAIGSAFSRLSIRLRNTVTIFSRSHFCAWATAGFGWGAAVFFACLAFILWK